MWEFSLYFDRELLPYFDKLKIVLKKLCKNELNCISISIKNDNFIFLIALKKESYNKNILFIKQKLAKIICLYYKPKFILKNIKNFDVKNDQNNILLYILYSIDITGDQNDIISKLSLCDKLFLSSFVNFKLSTIKKRWSEIGNLINENDMFLNDTTIKQELIKFLFSGLSASHETIKIIQKDKQLILLDKNNINIEIMSLYINNSVYENVLFTLICNCPKTVEIDNYKNFDVHFLQQIYNLFNERVKLLE